jgi:predicted transposase YbfD/YdcC
MPATAFRRIQPDFATEPFAALDAEQFQTCFVNWVAAITGIPADVIAIDGKSVRRSHDKKSGKPAIHMVSAFATRQRLILGQVNVAEKSNEIAAIPKLLDILAIKGPSSPSTRWGASVRSRPRSSTKRPTICWPRKANQGSLHEDVALFAREQKSNCFKEATISEHKSVEGDHGRIETHRITVIHEIGWLQQRHGSPGLRAVVMVESERENSRK